MLTTYTQNIISSRQAVVTKGMTKGFTLVELMIVVAIIGILASIALPAYQSSVIKAGRADGKVSLLGAAQTMERCFTTSNTYVGCTILATSGEGKYTMAFASGFPTATAFTIVATPATGTSQIGDTECANLSINQAGQQFISGTGAVATCW